MMYIGEGEMKRENAIQYHLHDFIRQNNLEHVTSIRKYVGYNKLGILYHGTVSFRRWSLLTENSLWEQKDYNEVTDAHWCSRTHACRKQLQFSIQGRFTLSPQSIVLQQELCYNQFNTTFINDKGQMTRKKRKEMRLYHTGSGIGSYIHFLSTAMSLAIDEKRVFTSGKSSDDYTSFHNYTNCKNEDISCYFKPLFPPLTSSNLEKEFFDEESESIDCEPVIKNKSHPTQNADCLYLSYQRMTALGLTPPFRSGFNRITEYIPEKYRENGILWFRSQLQHFALQPNDKLYLAIMFAKLTVGFENDFVAVHVRHGDKSTETAVFHLDKYMDSIKKMSDLHGTRTIFISTEDQDVIDSLYKYPEYDFKYTKGHKRQNIAIEEAFKLNLSTPENEAFIAFKNLFLAMTGTSFVGTFSSNWSRLVYELMYASHGGSHVDFISLDMGYVT